MIKSPTLNESHLGKSKKQKGPMKAMKQDFKVVRSFNLFTLDNEESHNNKKFPIDMQWLPDGKQEHVVVSDSLGDLNLVDAKNKVVRSKLRLDKTWLYSIDCSSDRESLLAVGSLAGKIHLVNCRLEQNKRLVESQGLTGHRGAVKTVKYLSNEYLISGSSDSLIGVWNMNQTHKYMAMLQGHMNDINTLDVNANDSNIFLSGGADVSVKVWDIRLKSPEVCSFLGGESSITCVKFVPGFMETFAVSSDDSKIR